MVKYLNNGKQVLHIEGETHTHIADCGNNEMAHAIATSMNERSQHFIADALVTRSPLFHGDMVSNAQFKGRLNGAIDALNKLDQVKKSLFYGRDNNLISEGQRDVSDLPSAIGVTPTSIMHRNHAIDLIHGILGMATEAGELLEALKAALNSGDPVDWVNVQEECGDSAWYMALLANAGDFTFEEVEQRIIRKLKERFADKFSAAEANTRNLDAERAVLEDKRPVHPDFISKEIIDVAHPAFQPPEMVGVKGVLVGLDLDGPDYTGINDALAPVDDNLPVEGARPNLQPATPASGKAAVNVAEAEANQAFSNVGKVPPLVEPETPSSSELAKSPAERLTPLPGEDTAQQNARD